MTEKELQKKSRQDLLELLLEAEKENVSLREENEFLRNELDEKQLKLGKIGSIAEASLALNGVFEAAQASADQYVQNVKRICEEKAQQILQSEDIVRKARLEAKRIREETELTCQRMIQQAKTESDHYWNMIRNSEEGLDTGSD
jgi:cell division septum initiation protein DivIVA